LTRKVDAPDVRPSLSIAVGTTEGWPYVRPILEAIREDVEAVGAEILFADGSDRPPPTADEIGRHVRWLKSPGTPVFGLYAQALRTARAEIIATTEDHALPRPGWVRAILRAHAEHPEAAAVGGAIENGSRGALLDWASYFITQGQHMAPLGDRQVSMTTNEANVSYKRRAVDAFDDNGGLGFMAILHNRRLAERGEILRVDDRMVVDHFETAGIRATSAIHFHNGRSIAGFRRQSGMDGEDWLRLAVSLVLPVWRTVRAVRVGLAKGRLRREILSSAPLALWLDYCQGVGHLLGYIAGAGGSPNRLR
jgi:hypothetical protein